MLLWDFQSSLSFSYQTTFGPEETVNWKGRASSDKPSIKILRML